MEVTGMAAVLTTLTSVGTSLLAIMGNVVTWIMAEGHELALISFGVIFFYTAIASLRRII